MIIKRRHFKQKTSLQDRIVEWAVALRKQADVMRAGPERDELLKNCARLKRQCIWKIGPIHGAYSRPNRNDRSPSLRPPR